jgi:hypothetical protein
MYIADFLRFPYVIRVYDVVDDGTKLANGKVFVTCEPSELPDGSRHTPSNVRFASTLRAPRSHIGCPAQCRAAAKTVSASRYWTVAMFELPGVGEDGMSGRNVQQKLGTTRGSPRRSRTAKASRISRHAVKSRCAREWDGCSTPRASGSGRSRCPSAAPTCAGAG